ncbi:MAG: HlyD family type I secretion periplasmic adaptor subunit [Burkholderiales bacterium]
MNATPTSTTATSLADALRRDAPDETVRGALHVLRRHALWAAAATAMSAGLWVALAPLSGAVIAPAQLKVELNRKTVQHQEGGIVREIFVRDGAKVRAGDPLLVVADVRSDAALRVTEDQLRSERVRKARAMAEAALESGFAYAAEPSSGALAEYAARERALFTARRRMLDEQTVSLQSQAEHAQAQVTALLAQIEATETSARLSAEELEINEKLVRQGFVQRTRILALQRTEADYRAKVGEYRSELAVARQRIAELQSRLAQARNQYQGQAADELKDATAKVRELEERLRPSQDQVERQVVRAPVDGEVMAMRVSSPGAVLGPRDPILDVVPGRERLVVEARIRPHDIDHVRSGGAAEVRLGAFPGRDTPLLPGVVTFVSADRVTSPAGNESWFVATIEIDGAALERYPRLRLHAGMPAEAYVKTPERSVAAYLARPIHDFSNRAMREP